MKNYEVARQFDLMADVLELEGENVFRIRAYRRAARNVESLSEDIEVVAREHRLEEIPGIGADLAGKITEYLETGRIADIEKTSKTIPHGVVELMRVPGIGPRTAKLLYEKQHITSVARLEDLARKQKLRGLPGIQAKTEENILRGLRVLRGGQERMPLGKALPLARELVAALARVRGVADATVAGSMRRGKETVGDIDVLVASTRPAPVIEAFARLPQVADVLEKGTTKGSIRHREGIQVDLRVVEPDCYGAALVYFTGSKQHNIRLREMAMKRGLKISEYGVFRVSNDRRIAGATEEDVYAAVGLPWIAPELREDAGEIDAALDGRLPHLIERGDIRGDLHCHTKASDGHHTVEALVAAAEDRGYRYVAVTDHSPATRIAGGLTADELAAHVDTIHEAQRKHPKIRVLAGSECDVLPDGSMDYPDDVLATLDIVVAAVHGRLKQSKAEMTRRMCRALANPFVHVLAHPTGRLIGEREAYAVDVDQVLRTAKRFGKAVEINAYPERLDLGDAHARRAHEIGALVAIGTDAHMLDHLGYMELGVAIARRGWLEARDVVNTWPVDKLLGWARAPRHGGRAKATG